MCVCVCFFLPGRCAHAHWRVPFVGRRYFQQLNLSLVALIKWDLGVFTCCLMTIRSQQVPIVYLTVATDVGGFASFYLPVGTVTFRDSCVVSFLLCSSIEFGTFFSLKWVKSSACRRRLPIFAEVESCVHSNIVWCSDKKLTKHATKSLLMIRPMTHAEKRPGASSIQREKHSICALLRILEWMHSRVHCRKSPKKNTWDKKNDTQIMRRRRLFEQPKSQNEAEAHETKRKKWKNEK